VVRALVKLHEDGRLVRGMYLFQMKSPQESKNKDDIYKLLATVPGEGGVPAAERWEVSVYQVASSQH
jgi:hypothetical protein